jgi:hypothetical protein
LVTSCSGITNSPGITNSYGLSFFGKRGLPQYVKAQVEEDKICFQTEPIGGDKEKQDDTNA